MVIGSRNSEKSLFRLNYFIIMLWRCIQMAYSITDACISCGACASSCPCDAISEGDTQYVIDADKCCSCGACAAGCPVEAIVED